MNRPMPQDSQMWLNVAILAVIWILIMLLTSSCGAPPNVCNVIYGKDQFASNGRCPPNTILVGVSGSQLTCADVTVACPKEGK